MKALAEKVIFDKERLNIIGVETLNAYTNLPIETNLKKFVNLPAPKPLTNTEVFQLYIRMSNANKLYNTEKEANQLILSILDYIEYNGLKPFSTVKGETNYPQQYDYNCINKFRIQFNLELYIYKGYF